MFLTYFRRTYQEYDPRVWWIVLGTVVTRAANFMTLPFLALYLGAHTHASAGMVGVVVGSGPLFSTFYGFFAGRLTDRYGRKTMMVIGMALYVIVMLGFATSRHIGWFMLFSILNGAARSTFEPASQAMISDITPEEKRARAFGWRYWAINVGASIGPILGAYFGTVSTGITFYVAALVNLAYGVCIFLRFTETNPAQQEGGPAGATLGKAMRMIVLDKALLVFIVAGLFSNFGYSQIESTLPQYVSYLHPGNGAVLYSMVLTSNAIEVVLLQMVVTKLFARLPIVYSLLLGQLVFGAGFFCLAFSHSAWALFLSMFVITMGELLVFPMGSQYLSLLAPKDLRATYFGSNNLRSIGFFLGPSIGGVILGSIGGMWLFLLMTAMMLASGGCYVASNRLRIGKVNSVSNVTFET